MQKGAVERPIFLERNGMKNRVNGGAVGSPPSKLVRKYVHIGEKTGVGPLVGDAGEMRER